MKQRSFSKNIGTLFATLSLAASGLALAGPDSGNCNDAKFQGSFAFTLTGFIVGVAPTPLPAAILGVFQVDGKGNMTGSEVMNVAGRFSSDTFTDGKYRINSDCTGTATWTAIPTDGTPAQPRSATFAVTNNFKELQILHTGGMGSVLSGFAKQQ